MPKKKVIAKGISSVKYMNADVANELYELAKAGKPESFMDLLMQLDEKNTLGHTTAGHLGED